MLDTAAKWSVVTDACCDVADCVGNEQYPLDSAPSDIPLTLLG